MSLSGIQSGTRITQAPVLLPPPAPKDSSRAPFRIGSLFEPVSRGCPGGLASIRLAVTIWADTEQDNPTSVRMTVTVLGARMRCFLNRNTSAK